MLIVQLLLIAVFVAILRQRMGIACIYEKRKYLIATVVFGGAIALSVVSFFIGRGQEASANLIALFDSASLLLTLISVSELVLTYLLFRKREMMERLKRQREGTQPP